MLFFPLVTFVLLSGSDGSSSPLHGAFVPSASPGTECAAGTDVRVPRPSTSGRAARQTTGLSLIENAGQWDCAERYVATLSGSVVRADQHSLGVQIFDRPGDSSEGVFVRFVFEGAAPGTTLIPENPGEARYSWFVGNDPAKWVHSNRGYAALRWHGLYEGIDFVLREDRGALKFDLEVGPSADLSRVRIRCEGTESVTVDAQGALVLATAKGCLTQDEALSFQSRADGRQAPIACRYTILDVQTFGFDVDGRDPAAGLWIDPPLQWSTYLGGGSSAQGGIDLSRSVCLDRLDDIYTSGRASGITFPSTAGAYHQQSGVGNDCFVAKFRGSDGTLIFSSVFGGSSIQEEAVAVRADSQGCPVVAGWTYSNDFPSTPGAFDSSFTSIFNAAFCLKLSALGDQLLWSTFLESGQGQGGIFLTDLALDSSGAPIVVGNANPGYPTTSGAFDTTSSAAGDGFVTKLDPSGSQLIWSTYLGGNSADNPEAVEVDDQGRVTVAGETASDDFPTTPGAYMATYPGDTGHSNLFVTRLTEDGSALEWSTFLGGLNGGWLTDYLGGLALVPDGGVVITGTTFSQDWPLTPGAAGTQYSGSYVTRLDPSGSSLVYSTYLGTPSIPSGGGDSTDVTVDSSGIATVVEQAAGLATTPGAFDTTINGGYDVMLFRLNPTGTKFYYSTYLGGNAEEEPWGVVTTDSGRLTVVGATYSTDFPTTPGAYSPNSNGGSDCFITTFEPYLQGVEPYGSGTPSCHHPLVANATEMPLAGALRFGLCLSGAPPYSRGVCLIATASSTGGVPFFNSTLWLDRSSIIARIPVFTDSLGFTETALPLTGVAPGTQFWAQYFVRNSPDCLTGRLAASSALHLTVQ